MEDSERVRLRLRALLGVNLAYNNMRPIPIAKTINEYIANNGKFEYGNVEDFMRRFPTDFVSDANGCWTVILDALTINERIIIDNILMSKSDKKDKKPSRGGMTSRGTLRGSSYSSSRGTISNTGGRGGFSRLASSTNFSNFGSSRNQSSIQNPQSYSDGFQNQNQVSHFGSNQRNNQFEDDRSLTSGFWNQRDGERDRGYNFSRNDDFNDNRSNGGYRDEDKWSYHAPEEDGRKNYNDNYYNGYDRDNYGNGYNDDRVYNRNDNGYNYYRYDEDRDRRNFNNYRDEEDDRWSSNQNGRRNSFNEDYDPDELPPLKIGGRKSNKRVEEEYSGPPGFEHSGNSQGINCDPPPGFAPLNNQNEINGLDSDRLDAAYFLLKAINQNWPSAVSEEELKNEFNRNFKFTTRNDFDDILSGLETNFSQYLKKDGPPFHYRMKIIYPMSSEIEEKEILFKATLVYLRRHGRTRTSELIDNLNIEAKGGQSRIAYYRTSLKSIHRSRNDIYFEPDGTGGQAWLSLNKNAEIPNWRPAMPDISSNIGNDYDDLTRPSISGIPSQGSSENVARKPSVVDLPPGSSQNSLKKLKEFLRSNNGTTDISKIPEFCYDVTPFSVFRTSGFHHELYQEYTNGTFQVQIVAFEDLNNFWVRTIQDNTCYKKLSKKLNEDYSMINFPNIGTDKYLLGSNIVFFKNRKYERGIIQRKGGRKIQVLALDIGGIHDVSKEDIFPEYSNIPPLACHCSIGDYTLEGETTVAEIEDIERELRQHLKKNDLQYISIQGKNDDSVFVTLSLDGEREFPDLLIKQGKIDLFNNF